MADDHHPPNPLEALNARGLTAKREYVRGLEQRHDPQALSLLTECLCDESSFLRELAEQTFFRLGEAHAGALVPLLGGGLWYTRLSAARLLGRIAYRPAVPALLELCGDGSETVALAARDAIVAVARQRGAARIAHALHRLTRERRTQRLAEIAERDRTLAKNLERLMADVDLMAADHPDQLVDPEEPGASAVARPAAAGAQRPSTARAAQSQKPTAPPATAEPPGPKPAAAATTPKPELPGAPSPVPPKHPAAHAPAAPKTHAGRKPPGVPPGAASRSPARGTEPPAPKPEAAPSVPPASAAESAPAPSPGTPAGPPQGEAPPGS